MELGSHLATKLEPFVLMSKSAKGAAAAKLVLDAISAPGVYFFAELLDSPNVKELTISEQYRAHHALLEVFTYKTYQDYLQYKVALPELSSVQTTKLKHLSLLSYAVQQRVIPYSFLQTNLDIPTIRQLEDLIIDAIYLDIIRGKLDQKEQQFEVEYTIGRDVPPEAITDILASLENWSSTTATLLQALDSRLVSLAEHNATKAREDAEHEETLNSALKEVADRLREKQNANKRSAGGAAGRKDLRDEDWMDVDEPGGSEASRSKNRKYVVAPFSMNRLKRLKAY
ncbi:hypothetical protein B0F90DRAFT_1620707 [Multifurca ochricompacta]|uniref:PCI domain-containing protein n=1 Tax=Multifurca ochricompacta TaxID=376703 RepID=A0AAD4MBR0_9AGAM|nr:hypothetical protein B0F90DRAFT_1620707 [Multifurca ochricompacta]